MALRWLTNTNDPKKRDLPQPFDANDPTGKHRRHWLEGKVIGCPKASEKYTVEELEAMGLVGIYAVESEDA